MAYQLRIRRVAYDNIAIGSATGKERTIAGAVVPAITTQFGGRDNVAVNTTDIGLENIQAGVDPPTSENVDLTSSGTT